MMAFEERWADAVLSAFAPSLPRGASSSRDNPEQDDGRLAPREGEVDYREAIHEMMRVGTTLSRLGMRVALWIAALSPFWMRFSFRSLASLDAGGRADMLAELLRHRVFMVRELMLLLKLCACMALFRSPTLRARSGYDRSAEDEMARDALESGERVRLPIARDGEAGLDETKVEVA